MDKLRQAAQSLVACDRRKDGKRRGEARGLGWMPLVMKVGEGGRRSEKFSVATKTVFNFFV